MQVFMDSANVKAIEDAVEHGLIDGVTTNPSLIAKEGANFREVVEQICRTVSGPVSVEVVGKTYEEMITEGREIAKIADNVVVKVPMLKEGLRAVRELSRDGIRVNVTLVFSAAQALLAAKAGATYVSPFVGRLDDYAHVGMDVIRDIVKIYKNYALPAQVLAASVRHPVHFVEAALAGAHVVTVPPSVLHQLVKHPLTDVGLERFLADWQKVPQGIFGPPR
ncbi:MAG: fructose-6-phosphate aldolase [candidate division NC10 bacterium]|jgi:transaldolase|nr:fructose-6-phosphate aldolase [candidate division NC10 bacterium]MCH7895708.1 fructose-6-phosphate aldolase [candidate division NC10 bacterium]MCZ6551479.1 fructose-6-phosphate aldolase [candidate division NC10 bacterium]